MFKKRNKNEEVLGKENELEHINLDDVSDEIVDELEEVEEKADPVEGDSEEDDFDDEEEFDDEEDFDEEDFEEEELLEELTDEGKKEKSKKFRKTLFRVFGGIVLGILVLYLGVCAFFWKFFFYDTTINGVDYSFKSVESVETFMKEEVAGYELSLVENTGTTETIKGTEINLEYVKGTEIEELLNSQNPFLWPKMFWETSEFEAEVSVSYDEEKLQNMVAGLSCMIEENMTDSVSAYPIYEDGEVKIVPEVYGTRIDDATFLAKLDEFILGFQDVLNLEEEGCYVDPPYISESQEVVEAYEKMSLYAATKITYSTGEVLDIETIGTWLSVDESLEVLIDDAMITSYVETLAEKYNTVGTTRKITTPNGVETEVVGGTFGWKVNQEEEVNKIKEEILTGEEIQREMQYSTRGVSHGEADWGDTYAEVDITQQKMWYIKDGEVVLESDVVTGRLTPDRYTPQGVYSLAYKERDKVLRGTKLPDGTYPYESPVQYWMPFNRGIGFHDASWRSTFGGTIYKNGGSHGCINMPIPKAKELYSLIEPGIPVICHF